MEDGQGNLGQMPVTDDRGRQAIMTSAGPLLLAAGEALADGGPQQRNPEKPGFNVETAIVLELGAALLAEPPSQLTMIRVDNEKGIVTLTGEVDNPEVRRMAGEIASSHPGVASAINDLQISSSHADPPGPQQARDVDEKEKTNDY